MGKVCQPSSNRFLIKAWWRQNFLDFSVESCFLWLCYLKDTWPVCNPWLILSHWDFQKSRVPLLPDFSVVCDQPGAVGMLSAFLADLCPGGLEACLSVFGSGSFTRMWPAVDCSGLIFSGTQWASLWRLRSFSIFGKYPWIIILCLSSGPLCGFSSPGTMRIQMFLLLCLSSITSLFLLASCYIIFTFLLIFLASMPLVKSSLQLILCWALCNLSFFSVMILSFSSISSLRLISSLHFFLPLCGPFLFWFCISDSKWFSCSRMLVWVCLIPSARTALLFFVVVLLFLGCMCDVCSCFLAAAL